MKWLIAIIVLTLLPLSFTDAAESAAIKKLLDSVFAEFDSDEFDDFSHSDVRGFIEANFKQHVNLIFIGPSLLLVH